MRRGGREKRRGESLVWVPWRRVVLLWSLKSLKRLRAMVVETNKLVFSSSLLHIAPHIPTRLTFSLSFLLNLKPARRIVRSHLTRREGFAEAKCELPFSFPLDVDAAALTIDFAYLHVHSEANLMPLRPYAAPPSSRPCPLEPQDPSSPSQCFST